MTFQCSAAIDNACLDAIETAIGASAIMKIRSGSPPANCATADSGTVLATLNLPADWMAAASGRSKAMLGTWQDASNDASGTAGHWRIYASNGTTCHLQGTVGTSGADLIVATTTITAAGTFTVNSFTISENNG